MRLRLALALLGILLGSATGAEQARFLALGDSYTIGEGVVASGRWPAQVAATLRARGAAIADPEYIARTGWSTAELAAALAQAAPHGPYALVTLQIGVNDQFRGGEPAAYGRDLAHLLASAVALAGGEARRVVVMSIPDWGTTPFASGRDRAAIGRAIDACNDVCREQAAHANARWVDITAATRAATQEAGLIGNDGLHPTPALYARWAAAAADTAMAAIGNAR